MKHRLYQLAIFGEPPAFADSLHVGRPNIPDRRRLLERINDILDSRWLTNNGEYEKDFERRVAEFLGANHCIAVCNGTIGLELVIRATGLEGEVIVPSFTFVATTHALQWQNITPVFCDIDPATHNLEIQSVESMITPRTTGIIGVHVWGQTCDVAALTRIAAERRLKLIFDAAHAFGCSHKGKMVGNFGDAEVFSFHATKFFNTFEGGMVVTNDDALAANLRLLRNFGFTGLECVSSLGTNGKMHEISAAMGLTSLESLDEFIDTNRRHYRQYRRELSGAPGVRFLDLDETEKQNFQYVVIEIDEAVTGASSETLRRVLWAENCFARRYFYPGCHRMEPYRTLYPDAGAHLPQTELIANRVLVLPTGTAVQPEHVSQIAEIIRLVVANGGEVSAQVNESQTSASAIAGVESI